jgi:membrane protease YdiL (CAAX protease family)
MAIIKRYPVPFFLAATIAFTYAAGVGAFLIARKIQLWTGIELGWAGELVLKFGPSLAGILTIAITAGLRGVRDLLRRCVQWRGPISLYVAAIFLQPVILLLVLVLRGYGPQLQTVTIEAAIGAFAIQLLLNVFLGGGLSEELGWRGFMLPRLCNRYSPLVASVLVAVAWFAWHVPGYILFNKAASDPVLPFAVILLPFSIILTWVYLRSNQGLVLPILLHGSINASFYAMEELLPGVTNASDFQPAFDWWLAGIWCLLAFLVLAKWRSVFGRTQKRGHPTDTNGAR